eukprot:Nk52_evm2s1315 gene=Nk52_evmTU2s1315
MEDEDYTDSGGGPPSMVDSENSAGNDAFSNIPEMVSVSIAAPDAGREGAGIAQELTSDSILAIQEDQDKETELSRVPNAIVWDTADTNGNDPESGREERKQSTKISLCINGLEVDNAFLDKGPDVEGPLATASSCSSLGSWGGEMSEGSVVKDRKETLRDNVDFFLNATKLAIDSKEDNDSGGEKSTSSHENSAHEGGTDELGSLPSITSMDSDKYKVVGLRQRAESITISTNKIGGIKAVVEVPMSRSCYVFTIHNSFRKLCISTVLHEYFDWLIVLTILTNCVFLAMNNPPEVAEFVFTGIFTLEMILKIVSYGFVQHKGSYLRDSWNRLDFAVVLLGYLAFIPGVGNWSFVRTIRVLRALRAITVIPGLKTMVNSLIASFFALFDVSMMILSFMIIFAIIGVQLYEGLLRQKCVIYSGPRNWHLEDLGRFSLQYFNGTEANLTNVEYPAYVAYREGDMFLCGNETTSLSCPYLGQNSAISCVNIGPNPNFGYTSWDNFLWGLLNALQIVTLDFWEDIFQKTLATAGVDHVIYFILAVWIGSFFMLNLVLAVVTMAYETNIDIDKKEKEENEEKATDFDELITELEPSNPANRKLSIQQSMFIVQNGVKRYWYQLRKQCKCIIATSWFNNTVMVFILLNTLSLAADHPFQPEWLTSLQEISNYIFLSVFALEMVIKLLGLGFKGYWKDKWNILDGLVVIISFIELGVGGSLSALRSFRLLRVFKLAKAWPTMRNLIAIIGNSLAAVGNLCLVLALIIYMFAVTGQKLFGESYKAEDFPEGELPRWSFIDFYHSFLLIFRILCGEWIEALWETMLVTHWTAVFFYVAVIVIAQFLILNLFLALLLNAFSDYTPPEAGRRSTLASRQITIVKLKLKRLVNYRWFQSVEVAPLPADAEPPIEELTLDKGQSSSLRNDDSLLSSSQKSPESDSFNELSIPKVNNIDEKSENSALASASSQDKVEKTEGTVEQCIDVEAEEVEEANEQDMYDKSNARSGNGLSNDEKICNLLFNSEPPKTILCFPEPKWMKRSRAISLQIISHRYFDAFILTFIVLSSIALCFEDVNLKKRDTLRFALDILNIIFAVVFTLELLIKMYALGVGGYFSSWWNRLDAFIVAVTLADIFTSGGQLGAFKSIRTMRALRPLKAISRWQGMKIVINALLLSIPSISQVLLVCMVFWLIFSILGVQYFGGMFFKCLDLSTDPPTLLPTDIVNDKTECLAKNYSWENSKVNFDNVINGYLALFQVATFEGWQEVFDDSVDARGLNLQPRLKNNEAAYMFYVVFIIFGSFFSLNLFIGVILDNFNKMKKNFEGHGFLTEDQVKWVEATRKMCTNARPEKQIPVPKQKWAASLYEYCMSSQFEIIIMGIIVVNLMTMTAQHYQQSDGVTEFLRISNFIFTGIYIVEAILKLLAFRLHYFTKGWNQFDFIICLLSIAGVIIEEMGSTAIINPTLIRIVRVLRIGRILRLLKRAEGVKRLFVTLMLSLPSLVNIGSLLLLIMFIYSVIGMSLFGEVVFNSGINEMTNFQTFGMSLLSMFRLSTSAGWNDVLDGLMVGPPDCDPNYLGLDNGNCGNRLAAIIFFVSYVSIAFLIVINMYIAIVLENFELARREDEEVSDEDFEDFIALWEEFDPKATHTISSDKLLPFLSSLEPPFGNKDESEETVLALEIPLYDEKAHLLDVLKCLLKRVYGNVELPDSVSEELEHKMIAAFPTLKKYRGFEKETTKSRAEKVRAARLIQKFFRESKLRSEQNFITNIKDKINYGSSCNLFLPEDIKEFDMKTQIEMDFFNKRVGESARYSVRQSLLYQLRP